MFYYLVVSYDTHAMVLDEGSELYGPFLTTDDRDEAVVKDMSNRDLETSEVVNITYLMLTKASNLKWERSFVPSSDDNYFDEEIDPEPLGD